MKRWLLGWLLKWRKLLLVWCWLHWKLRRCDWCSAKIKLDDYWKSEGHDLWHCTKCNWNDAEFPSRWEA